MECNYKEGSVMNKGRKMTLRPGQLLGAVSWLASRWNWTPKTVRGFLDKLADEGMVGFIMDAEAPESGTQKGNQARVLEVCNYSRYQSTEDDLGQPPGQAEGKRGATEGQQYKEEDLKTLRKEDSTPLPPLGGVGPVIGKRRGRDFSQAEVQLSSQAVECWNATAARLGLVQCQSFTAARRRRMLMRLKDIGGMEQFKLALSQIHRVPFLMGKIPPKDDQQPFKLDIDRLLQTGGALGDVLAKLIDKSAEREIGPNGKAWGWWKDNEKQLKALSVDQWRKTVAAAKPNGVWPWWLLTGYPGTPDCCIHPDVIRENGMIERYGAQNDSR